MSAIIKIEIEIENQARRLGSSSGCKLEAKINEMLFEEYDRLLQPDAIKDNVKYALKTLKGFDMLTIYVSICDDSNYRKKDYVYGVRFISGIDGIIKRANLELVDSTFIKWVETNQAAIYSHLETAVRTVNDQYLRVIRGSKSKVN